jgi:serine protease Do
LGAKQLQVVINKEGAMLQGMLQVRRPVAIAAISGVLIAGGVSGAALSLWAKHSAFFSQSPAVVIAAGKTVEAAPANTLGFAPVLKPALAAVVNISSSRIVKTPSAPYGPFFGDPFFRQFFGDQFFRQMPREQREHSLGSGVIMSEDGYILTNNHVVDKATDIKVALPDKREFKGKVVGSDPKTDIAVVKISASELPTLAFGDSDKLQVGDYVFAIGDPFGIGETATMGIVSAKGRGNLAIEDYEDFIQTDAAINPGNSGGALINARGELIGINTAILAGNGGGNQGIGFAVPIDMARRVMDQILKNGKVTRGYLGVVIQEVTPELAKAFKAPEGKGALVGDVSSDGPGAKAGFQKGDVIEEIDGQEVSGVNDLRLRIASTAPGTTVHLKVFRNGEPRDVSVTLGQLPEKANEGPLGGGENESESTPMKGVQVDELTAQLRRELDLSPTIHGVVVTDVSPESPAAGAGLRRGDVIEEVNRHGVDSTTEYRKALRRAGNQSLVLLVSRNGNTTFIVIEPEKD